MLEYSVMCIRLFHDYFHHLKVHITTILITTIKIVDILLLPFEPLPARPTAPEAAWFQAPSFLHIRAGITSTSFTIQWWFSSHGHNFLSQEFDGTVREKWESSSYLFICMSLWRCMSVEALSKKYNPSQPVYGSWLRLPALIQLPWVI